MLGDHPHRPAMAIGVMRPRPAMGCRIFFALVRRWGMAHSAIVRLQADDHEPSLDMLTRLSRDLGLQCHIEIAL